MVASQRQFLFAQTGLTVAWIALLSAVGSLSLELVFVGAFIGFALITALTAPVQARPAWRSRLRWPLVAGTLVFLGIVGIRTFEKFVGTL